MVPHEEVGVGDCSYLETTEGKNWGEKRTQSSRVKSERNCGAETETHHETPGEQWDLRELTANQCYGGPWRVQVTPDKHELLRQTTTREKGTYNRKLQKEAREQNTAKTEEERQKLTRLRH